jgi:hypothetical protein
VTSAVPASSRITNDPTAIFNRPHDYDGPFCQQLCALGPRLTQITLSTCWYVASTKIQPLCYSSRRPASLLIGEAELPQRRWAARFFPPAASATPKGRRLEGQVKSLPRQAKAKKNPPG